MIKSGNNKIKLGRLLYSSHAIVGRATAVFAASCENGELRGLRGDQGFGKENLVVKISHVNARRTPEADIVRELVERCDEANQMRQYLPNIFLTFDFSDTTEGGPWFHMLSEEEYKDTDFSQEHRAGRVIVSERLKSLYDITTDRDLAVCYRDTLKSKYPLPLHNREFDHLSQLLLALNWIYQPHLATRPAQVVLPLSLDHRLLGNNGLVSESKASLGTLFTRWNSESGDEHLGLPGASLGMLLYFFPCPFSGMFFGRWTCGTCIICFNTPWYA